MLRQLFKAVVAAASRVDVVVLDQRLLSDGGVGRVDLHLCTGEVAVRFKVNLLRAVGVDENPFALSTGESAGILAAKQEISSVHFDQDAVGVEILAIAGLQCPLCILVEEVAGAGVRLLVEDGVLLAEVDLVDLLAEGELLVRVHIMEQTVWCNGQVILAGEEVQVRDVGPLLLREDGGHQLVQFSDHHLPVSDERDVQRDQPTVCGDDVGDGSPENLLHRVQNFLEVVQLGEVGDLLPDLGDGGGCEERGVELSLSQVVDCGGQPLQMEGLLSDEPGQLPGPDEGCQLAGVADLGVVQHAEDLLLAVGQAGDHSILLSHLLLDLVNVRGKEESRPKSNNRSAEERRENAPLLHVAKPESGVQVLSGLVKPLCGAGDDLVDKGVQPLLLLLVGLVWVSENELTLPADYLLPQLRLPIDGADGDDVGGRGVDVEQDVDVVVGDGGDQTSDLPEPGASLVVGVGQSLTSLLVARQLEPASEVQKQEEVGQLHLGEVTS